MILILNKNRAFTLLEAILAIFVTLVGTLAAYGLVQQVLASAYFSASKFTAAYLAKEGIEIVRNIRDTNWIISEEVEVAWNDGLTGCAAGCEADYNDSSLSAFSDTPLILLNGVQTKYKRKITIDDSGLPDFITVSVRVEWQEKGQDHQIIVQENLYEWWQ